MDAPEPRHPRGSGTFANVAPNSRTSSKVYADVRPDPERTALNNQFVPVVPDLAAFVSSREDLAAARARFGWAQDLAPALRPASTVTCPGRRMLVLTVPHNGIFTVTITASISASISGSTFGSTSAR